ncbi:DUF493 domain-containing protein [Eikenella sp. S3360]|uniref:UPF0250 protein H9Q10_11235 n=1 Tax=Eikenella glucosivorans TaxID=2766967 RepID=A0ABS0NDA0_9NEIS|nr:DUF493 domain-containing protein [Eikenella glucosivorans]MBH5330236.1 DUF493 domain-containing protein [Eikenella glucosivorans]
MSDSKPETLLAFPCRFSVKVMGEKHPEFAAKVLETVQQHAPDTAEHDLQHRESSKGNYQGVTVTLNAENKEQLDNIYRALTSHPMVKVVL